MTHYNEFVEQLSRRLKAEFGGHVGINIPVNHIKVHNSSGERCSNDEK